jgi:hypothetical protein
VQRLAPGSPELHVSLARFFTSLPEFQASGAHATVLKLVNQGAKLLNAPADLAQWNKEYMAKNTSAEAVLAGCQTKVLLGESRKTEAVSLLSATLPTSIKVD